MAKVKVELKDAMQHYGKQPFSAKEQIHILSFILEDAKNKLVKGSEIYNLIAEWQLKLKDEDNLKKAIKSVNELMVLLEAKEQGKVTINYLKKQGLYRILYRNPQIKGQELPPDDILHKLLRNGFLGVVVSAFIILLFAATAFFAAPAWLTVITTGLFIGASTYLSGMLYGLVNDLFATQANLPYFLLGHQPQQKSLLRTNDKIAQGVAWGIAATFGPVVLATILFTVVATITACFVPMATFLMPILMIAMPLIAVSAEFYARKRAQQYQNSLGTFFEIGSNQYQKEGLLYMCPTVPERAAWYANSDRNMFGFTKVPLIGLTALVGLVVLSAVSMFLPPVLFVSPLIAVVIPAACAATTAGTLGVAGLYMHVNRNKQVDDRYRLEFERKEIEPNLYFDEDMAYVHRLVNTYGKQELTIEVTPLDSEYNTYGSIFDHRRSVHQITEVPKVGLSTTYELGL